MSGVASHRAAEVERELDRLEADFYHVYATDPAAIEAVVPAARSTGAGALIGRGLCLLARALIGRGRHADAVETARAGIAAFDSLSEAEAEANFAARAEILRAGGNALLKLGRIGEALPLLEDAVAVAERAVARLDSSPAATARERAVHALVRCLSNLGSALLAVRELDTAIEIFERIATVGQWAGGAAEDDLLLGHWNRIDALHARVRRSRAAGDRARADADLAVAQTLLDDASGRIAALSAAVTGYGRQGFFASMGRHLLLTGQPAEALGMFERQIDAIAAEPASGMYDWVIGIAHAGMAQAALALESPHEALRHGALALSRFERHDEADERAPVLLVRATALRRLGEHAAAYAELEAYHELRSRLEAEAAQQFAGHVTAKLGLARARAEIESHRRMAATLETLGRIGQEITAKLDADAVIRILHRHVGTLLDAPSFCVWLLDPAGTELQLAFGAEDGRRIASDPVALDHPTSWVARAVRERQELVGDGPSVTVATAPQIAGTRFMRSAMFSPLVAGDRALGALTIQSDRPAAFGENERSIVRTLSTYGAIALDNAAAYRELGRAVSRLEVTQRELSLRTAEYERLSMTDALTGIPNRRHFMERASIETAEARRNDSPLGVAMLDIDRFKLVNDRFGHAAGDRVLQAVARAAKDGLRTADFLARIGGEEFALLLPGAGHAEAASIAERIRCAIERMTIAVSDTLELRVTASFGVATLLAGEESFDTAFARADGALYRSKHAGRNRVTSDV